MARLAFTRKMPSPPILCSIPAQEVKKSHAKSRHGCRSREHIFTWRDRMSRIRVILVIRRFYGHSAIASHLPRLPYKKPLCSTASEKVATLFALTKKCLRRGPPCRRPALFLSAAARWRATSSRRLRTVAVKYRAQSANNTVAPPHDGRSSVSN